MSLKESTSFFSLLISNKKYLLFLFFYSFVLLFFCSTFSPFYGFNDWPDVNIYYTIGKGILFDKVPYKDLFDHKGPIIFFIYALGYIISPDSFLGLFLIQGFSLFTILSCIYFIARLYLARIPSLLVSLVFPVSLFTYNGNGGSAEEFILCFMFISLFFFLQYFSSLSSKHSPLVMFLHGVFFSFVFLIKLSLSVFWIFPITFIIIELFLLKRFNNLFNNILLFLLGCITVIIPTLFYFYLNHSLYDLFEVYIIVNKKYGTFNLFDTWISFLQFFLKIRNAAKDFYIDFFLMSIGILYFCFSDILKKKLGRIALLCSCISLFVIIYGTPMLMLYYYVTYCLFVPLGLISIFIFLDKISIKYLKFTSISIYCSIFALSLFILALSIQKKDFFPYSLFPLEKKRIKDNVPHILAQEMSEDGINTLLCIGVNYGIPIFTKFKLVPNIKYFFTPNLDFESYPILYDNQLSYIKNKTIKFVIMNDNYKFKHVFVNVLSDNGYIAIKNINGIIIYKCNQF